MQHFTQETLRNRKYLITVLNLNDKKEPAVFVSAVA